MPRLLMLSGCSSPSRKCLRSGSRPWRDGRPLRIGRHSGRKIPVWPPRGSARCAAVGPSQSGWRHLRLRARISSRSRRIPSLPRALRRTVCFVGQRLEVVAGSSSAAPKRHRNTAASVDNNRPISQTTSLEETNVSGSIRGRCRRVVRRSADSCGYTGRGAYVGAGAGAPITSSCRRALRYFVDSQCFRVRSRSRLDAECARAGAASISESISDGPQSRRTDLWSTGELGREFEGFEPMISPASV